MKPSVRIISIINCGIKPEIINSMVDISKKFNIEHIVLKNIDKTNGHPTEKGMEQIKNQVLAII